jgi:hypothetical protein
MANISQQRLADPRADARSLRLSGKSENMLRRHYRHSLVKLGKRWTDVRVAHCMMISDLMN